jgi:hypothetical protein
MLRPCEEERRRQSIGDRGIIGNNPRRNHISNWDTSPGIKHMVQTVAPSAFVDRRGAQDTILQISNTDRQMRVEWVLKPNPEAGLTRMAHISATIDNEPGESGFAQDFRDNIHEVALPHRANVN